MAQSTESHAQCLDPFPIVGIERKGRMLGRQTFSSAGHSSQYKYDEYDMYHMKCTGSAHLVVYSFERGTHA